MNEIQEISRQRQKWIDVVNAGDGDRYAALLTADAVWLPPGMPAIRGKQAIRAWLEPFFEKFDYEFSISNEEVRVAGDYAIERAAFTSKLTLKTGGESMQHNGCYIVFWRQEPDGTWKIERYIDDTGSRFSEK